MMGRTHLAIGVAGAVDVALATHNPIGFAGVATAVVCSLLPDIDEENSMLSHRAGGKIGITILAAGLFVFGLINAYIPDAVMAVLIGISPHLTHRKFTHTVFALAIIIGYLLWLGHSVGVPDLALFGGVAYGLHILADIVTNTGVPIIYPISKKKISLHLMNTGSGAEVFVAIIPIAIFIVMAASGVV